MPLLLLGRVYLSLRRALEEVAWEVRTRQAIRTELGALGKKMVRSEVDLAQHTVRVQLVIAGDSQKAETRRSRLAVRIAAAAGLPPDVEVLAVADAEKVREAMQAPQAPATKIVREPNLDTTAARVASVLARTWPTNVAGELRRTPVRGV